MHKNDFGYNGNHKKLGNEIGAAEFRGYVTAKLEELNNLEKRVSANEKTLWVGIGAAITISIIINVVF